MEEKQHISYTSDYNADFHILWDQLIKTGGQLCPFRVLEKLKLGQALESLYDSFIASAEHWGKIIIREYNLPTHLKQVQPADNISGRAGGQKYIVDGIFFKFALDKHGFYDGDDYAAKAAGNELIGLIEVVKSTVSSKNIGHMQQKCHIPITVLIRYLGFTLIASSVLPIDDNTIVYGSHDAGKSIHAGDDVVNFFMKRLGHELNCRPHKIRSKLVYTAFDVEVHKGHDGLYYMADFARLLPPTAIEVEGERLQRSNCNPTLFRLFRPEFLKHYTRILNPDAYLMEDNNSNSEADLLRIQEATSVLTEQIIPICAQSFSCYLPSNTNDMNDYDPLFFSFTKNAFNDAYIFCDRLKQHLHRCGINLRYFGKVWCNLRALALDAFQTSNNKYSKTPECEDNKKIALSFAHMCNMLLIEMSARCFKHNLFWLVRRAVNQEHESPLDESEVKKIYANFFNEIFDLSMSSALTSSSKANVVMTSASSISEKEDIKHNLSSSSIRSAVDSPISSKPLVSNESHPGENFNISAKTIKTKKKFPPSEFRRDPSHASLMDNPNPNPVGKQHLESSMLRGFHLKPSSFQQKETTTPILDSNTEVITIELEKITQEQEREVEHDIYEKLDISKLSPSSSHSSSTQAVVTPSISVNSSTSINPPSGIYGKPPRRIRQPSQHSQSNSLLSSASPSISSLSETERHRAFSTNTLSSSDNSSPDWWKLIDQALNERFMLPFSIPHADIPLIIEQPQQLLSVPLYRNLLFHRLQYLTFVQFATDVPGFRFTIDDIPKIMCQKKTMPLYLYFKAAKSYFSGNNELARFWIYQALDIDPLDILSTKLYQQIIKTHHHPSNLFPSMPLTPPLAIQELGRKEFEIERTQTILPYSSVQQDISHYVPQPSSPDEVVRVGVVIDQQGIVLHAELTFSYLRLFTFDGILKIEILMKDIEDVTLDPYATRRSSSSWLCCFLPPFCIKPPTLSREALRHLNQLHISLNLIDEKENDIERTNEVIDSYEYPFVVTIPSSSFFFWERTHQLAFEWVRAMRLLSQDAHRLPSEYLAPSSVCLSLTGDCCWFTSCCCCFGFFCRNFCNFCGGWYCLHHCGGKCNCSQISQYPMATLCYSAPPKYEDDWIL